MDIVENKLIKDKLINEQSKYFKCPENIKSMVCINPINNTSETLSKLYENIDKIIQGNDSNINYYLMQKLFIDLEYISNNSSMYIFLKYIVNKIKTLSAVIKNENNNISLESYDQLWVDYRILCSKLFEIIKVYQKYLSENNICIKKSSQNIISIFQTSIFYDYIFKEVFDNLLVQNFDQIENFYQVDQLINYVDSFRMFSIMAPFVKKDNETNSKIDENKIILLIKKIINKNDVINLMCKYVDTLIKSYEGTEHNRKIYKIMTILNCYSDPQVMLECYRKYFQSRIISVNKINVVLEKNILNKILKVPIKIHIYKLLNTMNDVETSKKYYETFMNDKIKNKIYKPLLLNYKNWNILNKTKIEPIYPKQMQKYFDHMNEIYDKISNSKKKIIWKSTMGTAKFNFKIGNNNIEVHCNMLQTILIFYLNEHSEVSLDKFSLDVQLNSELCIFIIRSLYESNLIIEKTKNGNIYVINKNNYTGDKYIDLHHVFISLFDIDQESYKYQ